MDKKQLSERDICTKFITPALKTAGWDEMSQIREKVSFTKGRIIVRGNLSTEERPATRCIAISDNTQYGTASASVKRLQDYRDL